MTKSNKPAAFLLLLACLILPVISNAQTWQWLTGAGTSLGGEAVRTTCTDAAGNAYFSGNFTGSITIGGFPLTSAGGTDVFVAKFNAAGTCQWAVRGGSSGAGTDAANGIVTDGTTVYITGTIAPASAVFGGFVLTTNANAGEGFFAALNASTGAFTWATNFSNTPGGGDVGHAMCMDGSGGLYAMGNFNGTINFGSAPYTSNGIGEVFIAKVNPANGAFIWGAVGGSPGTDNGIGSSLCFVPGLNEIVAAASSGPGAGSFYTTSPASGPFTFTNTGLVGDIVLLELNASTGAILSLLHHPGANQDDCLGVCYDPSTTNVMLAGYFQSPSITFGSTTLTNAGAATTEDIFIASYNPTTNTFPWAVRAGGTLNERAWGVSSAGNGVIAVTGQFRSSPTAFGSTNLNCVNAFSDVFVTALLPATGAYVWAIAAAGDGGVDDVGRAVAYTTNGSGNVYVCGQFAGTMTAGALPTITSNNGSADLFFAKLLAPPPLVATQSQVNLTCNGVFTGSAAVVASGGVSPYTYSWSPSGGSNATASSLSAQNYTCTITDNVGTQITKTFTITQPTAIVTVPSQTNILCFGGNTGSASVAASGGTGTFFYNWTPNAPLGDLTNTASGLTQGSWSVVVTDQNSCTHTRTFNITQPTTLVLTNSSQTNISCAGGSNGTASVNAASGGAGGYTYNWTPGNPPGDGSTSVTGLSQGTWTCTVTDANSCTRTATFNITQPSPLVLTFASQTNISCNGGSNGAASVNPASGGAGGYLYNWTPGNPTGEGTTSVTGLGVSTYTCTVTDVNSCTATVTFAITQPSVITVTPVSQTNVSCNAGSNGTASVNASGGTGSLSYNWTPGNPTGDGSASVTGLIQGTWTCTVTDVNLCIGTTTFNITQPTALVLTAATQTNVSCGGGSNGAASVNAATGGAGGYSYNWTPGNPTGDGSTSVSGLAAGTWTCTVTDINSCTQTVTFNITQPTPIVIAPLSQTNISCNGGSNGAASVSAATGGAGGYSYNWTPGNPTGEGTTSVTGLGAGTWTCTVTDINSCTASATFNITQPPVITVTPLSQTNIFCNGGSNGAASVSASGGTGSLSYNWTPGNPTGDGSASVTGLTVGTWTCTVTDVNLCVATATFNVTEPPTLVLTSSSQTNVSCGGGSNGAASVNAATGGAGGYTYNWTPGNPTGDGTTSVSGLSFGTYTCTVTDVNSCTATVTFNVTQPSPVVVTSLSQTNISCNGGSDGAASVSASGGTGSLSYNWTPGNPTGEGTASVTGLTAGTWTCTVTDLNSCTGSATFNITQPPVLTVVPVSQTNISCNGGSNGAASVSAAGGTGSLSYNWTPGNPTGDGTVSVTGLTAGTWTCTVTDVNSCVQTATFNITQPPVLVLTASTQTNVSCTGGSDGAASVNAASGGAGGYSYNWTPGNPTGDGSTSVTGLSAGTFTCTVTDANSCIATVTFNITEASGVVLTASSHTDITCNSDNDGTATVNTATGGSGSFTYNWAPGNPTGDGTTSVTALSPGTYTCTATDINGCSASATFTITEPDALVVSVLSVTHASCNAANDGSASVDVSGGTPGYSPVWTPSGGTGFIESNLVAGTYTCTVTDLNGCTDSQTVNITEPTAVSANTSSSQASCGGNDGSATAVGTGGTPGYTYSWVPSGGTGSVETGLGAGTYTCTITDVNGCTGTVTVVVTSAGSSVVASIISSSNVSCNGGSNGSATVSASGGDGNYSYSWSPSGGASATASGLNADTYTVTVADGNGCDATATVVITEPPAIASAVIGLTDVSCNGGNNGSATITASGGTGVLSYDWTPGNPSGDGTNSVSGLTAGTWTCTITDANSCVATQTVSIAEPALLSVLAGGTSPICVGQPTALSANASGGTAPYTYTWMPGSLNGSSVVASPATTTVFTVNVVDDNGCNTSGTVNIVVNPTPTLTVVSNPVSGVVCTNTPATLTANGAVSYNWTGGITNGVPFTPPSTTTYTVTGTAANGCQSTATRTITVQPCSFQTQLTSTYCGATNVLISTTIAANAIQGATNYEFLFVHTPSGYSQSRVKGNSIPNIPLSWLPGLQYGNTYSVQVRAFVNSTWQPYGPVCTLTLNAQVPTTQLSNCAATNQTVSNTLFVIPVASAQDYEYEVTNAQQPYSVNLFRGSPTPSIGIAAFLNVQYGRTYNVRVRAKVGGVWGAFGNTCTFTMQAVNPATQLTPAWCGATGLTATSSISYNPVGAATNYLIKIENPALGYSQVRTKGNGGTYISLNNFSGLQINQTYMVTIASCVGGVWGAYGPACSITMGASTRLADMTQEEQQSAFSFAMLMYPNPLGDNVNPTVNITGADGQIAMINIVDITGRVVATYEIMVAGDDYSTVLEGFPDLVAGIYFMQVQVGDQVQSQKFIAE